MQLYLSRDREQANKRSDLMLVLFICLKLLPHYRALGSALYNISCFSCYRTNRTSAYKKKYSSSLTRMWLELPTIRHVCYLPDRISTAQQCLLVLFFNYHFYYSKRSHSWLSPAYNGWRIPFSPNAQTTQRFI